MTSPLVAANNVSKNYKRGSETVHALHDVDFCLFPGEVVALIGPSGSGKSTLLNLLARWEEPDTGTFSWNGAPGAPPSDWQEVAVLPQKLGLINELSVEENVALPLRLLTGAKQNGIDVQELLESLGLSRFADRLPQEISVGEQQRTALARALVLGPSLLLLDEPTGHQDADWVNVIFEMLKHQASNGGCCLVATHNAEVLTFSDRILEIRDGAVHETDSPSVLVAELEAEIAAPPHSDQTPPSEDSGDHSVWRRRPNA